MIRNGKISVENRNEKKKCKNGIYGRMTALLLAVFLFTGCGNNIPELSVEQQQAVGEYAAMVLLKYDADHRSRLVDLSLIPEETLDEKEVPEMTLSNTENTAENTSQGMRPVEDTPVIDMGQAAAEGGAGSMEDCMGLPEGITVQYQGMKVMASYPEDGQADDYFTLDAAPGKSLLVLNFSLSNQAQSEQNIDLLNQDLIFKVTVNGNYTRAALMTMLMNDMSTYVGSLPAGGSEELVLLIEVDQEVADSISSISLSLKNESKIYTISLL